VVYLLEKVRKALTKQLYKELTIGHLGIDRTREAIAACYYFLLIGRLVEQVVKECDIC
jgi:hypothetical protein